VTIFVGGIHGVGKTFLCKPASLRLNLVHATASQLIRQERGHCSWSDRKEASEVDENQRALVNAVSRTLAESRGLLLDGHFVLRRAVGQHEQISVEVFERLCCIGFVVLTAPISVLAERLIARGDRSWTAGELSDFAEAELLHGRSVAEKLGRPLIALDLPSELELEQAVLSMLAKRMSLGEPHGLP
jgi:adenylate kinase